MDTGEANEAPREASSWDGMFASPLEPNGQRDPLRLAIATGAIVGILTTLVLVVIRPEFFDEDLGKNLFAEAVGAFVFTGLVALMLKARDDQQSRAAERLLLNQVGHWVARIFINAALLLPSTDRMVTFVNIGVREGYSFPAGATITSIKRGVLRCFEHYTAREGMPDAELRASEASEYYQGIETEFGQGTWDMIHDRIRRDLEMIDDLVVRFNLILVKRQRPLFEKLAELQEVGMLLGEPNVLLLTKGIYALIFRTADRVAEELDRLGYPSRLRTHAL